MSRVVSSGLKLGADFRLTVLQSNPRSVELRLVRLSRSRVLSALLTCTRPLATGISTPLRRVAPSTLQSASALAVEALSSSAPLEQLHLH